MVLEGSGGEISKPESRLKALPTNFIWNFGTVECLLAMSTALSPKTFQGCPGVCGRAFVQVHVEVLVQKAQCTEPSADHLKLSDELIAAGLLGAHAGAHGGGLGRAKRGCPDGVVRTLNRLNLFG